jgi:hypothetical protein
MPANDWYALPLFSIPTFIMLQQDKLPVQTYHSPQSNVQGRNMMMCSKNKVSVCCFSFFSFYTGFLGPQAETLGRSGQLACSASPHIGSWHNPRRTCGRGVPRRPMDDFNSGSNCVWAWMISPRIKGEHLIRWLQCYQIPKANIRDRTVESVHGSLDQAHEVPYLNSLNEGKPVGSHPGRWTGYSAALFNRR